jgi:hypothetical protein
MAKLSGQAGIVGSRRIYRRFQTQAEASPKFRY